MHDGVRQRDDGRLADEIVAAADLVVGIPMYGINHSFPVTVAAGIAMAEWTRRHYVSASLSRLRERARVRASRSDRIRAREG